MRAALGVFGAAAAPHVPARVEIGSCASMARVPDADPRTVRQRVELAEAHDRGLGHRPVPRAEDVEERVLDGDAVARRELVAGGARELVRRGREGALDRCRRSHCVYGTPPPRRWRAPGEGIKGALLRCAVGRHGTDEPRGS